MTQEYRGDPAAEGIAAARADDDARAGRCEAYWRAELAKARAAKAKAATMPRLRRRAALRESECLSMLEQRVRF